MADCLTEEQITEFREAFLQVDKDRDGVIYAKEVRSVLRCLGMGSDEIGSLEELNGIETLDFPSFLSLMARRMNGGDREEDLMEPFRAFDTERTGLISPAELRHVLASFGEKYTDEEVDEITREADPKDEGQINYEEWLRMMLAK